ncbi:MAG: ATP-binding protein [Cyanothece sp. SIO1E1]|nr:ATP-binding protein [Cyanothece sp. SIO1E1]
MPWTSVDTSQFQDLSAISLPHTTVELVGRDADLEVIHQALQETPQASQGASCSATVLTLTGMPGVGKSELALQYAWRHQANYSGGICWINACDDDIAARIVQFAEGRFDGLKVTQKDIASQLSYCCRYWPGTGLVLIVIDDLNEDDYRQLREKHLGDFTSRFKFLLISRKRLGNYVQSWIVKPLAQQDAFEIFNTLLEHDPRLLKETATLSQLCEDFGNLPLPLQLVAGYLNAYPELSIAEVFTSLQENGLSDPMMAEADPTTIARRGVAAALEASWTHLPNSDQQFAIILSQFASAPIPDHLIKAVIDRNPQLKSLLAHKTTLREFNLLQNSSSDTILLNRLIHEFLQAKLASIDIYAIQHKICKILARACRTLPGQPTVEQLGKFQDVLPHAQHSIRNFTDVLEDQDAFSVCTAICSCYQRRGLLSEAIVWSEQFCKETKIRFGNNHIHTATANKTLALALFEQGNFNAAKAHSEHALKICTQLTESGYLISADIQTLLAAIHRQSREFSIAKSYAQHAIKIYKYYALAAKHTNFLTARITLATIHLLQGQHLDKLEPALKRFETLKRQALSANHPDMAEIFNLRAMLYEKLHRFEEAIPLHQRALNINETAFGEHHPHTATSYNNLAKVYEGLGDVIQAQSYYTRAIDAFRVLGNTHGVGWCLRNRGFLLAKYGQDEQAVSDLSETYEILLEYFGSGQPEVEECYECLKSVQARLSMASVESQLC